ncbi:hypothetical protein MPLDJ20_100051 [Mesorhizobium plurifarium]|uniref:Uncharacterized protein n=1 Tax=Mesorhizobium plurifarium TaxID=69974 RepID=A0A090DJR1_MESPL|nr:hypothetical protein MPLDJ20_100051 [Mesorhizobium plurifarium]CDX38804.1 hypothetical protein MPLSOD_340052 [Mesorhizobium sp. SOD10]
MIPRPAWQIIKQRLGRTPAGSVAAAHRAALHRLRGFIANHYPWMLDHFALVPISTMQWSSVVMGYGDSHVAFIDIEQANALELLLLRGFWGERPIISHVEYLIRAAEAFYDDGDLVLAAAVTERANARLAAYSADQGAGTFIPRPKYYDEQLVAILQAQLLLSFIAGHEVAHILQQAEDASSLTLFAWIGNRYQELRFDRSRDGPPRERFLLPETLQKFDDFGQPNGVATLGTKMGLRMHAMIERLTGELQADGFGLLAASHAAIETHISADTVFRVLFMALEYTEMLMMLRRLLPRLPRGMKRAAIAHEGPFLFARHMMLVRLVRGVREGEVSVPKSIRAFWRSLDPAVLRNYEILGSEGKLEQYSLRSAVAARGGIEVGLAGSLGKHVPAAERVEKLGPLVAGGLIVAEAHRGFGEAYFRAEEHFDWGGAEGEPDPVLLGFAHALQDMAELAATETRPKHHFTRASVLRNGSDSAFVEFLRSTRSQVFRMAINPDWMAGFEAMLR